MKTFKSRIGRGLGQFAAFMVLVISFQNCGKMTAAQKDRISDLGSTSEPGPATASPTPSPQPSPAATPTPTPTPGGTVFDPGALQVCPSGCKYSKPSLALAAAFDGDTIEIQAAEYADCLLITKNNITVRGIGGRAHLKGVICAGKGVIVTAAQNAVLENLELSNYQNADQNAAGIRHDATGKNLTARNILFHDGQFGILGSSADDTVIVDGCIFDGIGQLRPDGSGEINVPIFTSMIDRLYIRNSQFLNPTGGASPVKSRALQTIIDCSVISDLQGSDSYSIDFYSSPDVTLLNSVIAQGAASDNSNMVVYGTSTPRAGQKKITVKNNIMINDKSSGTFLNVMNGAGIVSDISGNTFVGPGTVLSGSGTLGSNTQFATRQAAGLSASPSLPMPAACTTQP